VGNILWGQREVGKIAMRVEGDAVVVGKISVGDMVKYPEDHPCSGRCAIKEITEYSDGMLYILTSGYAVFENIAEGKWQWLRTKET
jgi:hypothetical protein